MPSLTDFQQDIARLRELFKTAPLIQFQRAARELLVTWREREFARKAGEITTLSQLYAQLVRDAAGSSVYTPADLAAELFEKTPWEAGDAILDCSGGTGNLARPFAMAGAQVTLMDKDETALAIAEMELPGIRVIRGDFLKSDGQWDVIIGNPPWEGHKTMSLEDKAALREAFPGVMGNKADLHFAFFIQAHERLRQGGTLAFLVSRYWLEAESARSLRQFILRHFTITYLHDWYGVRPFGAGVDPLLIVLKKQIPTQIYGFPVRRQDAGAFMMRSDHLSEFSMKLLTSEERRLRRIIAQTASQSLGEAGSFHQGIITGFDKAFIMSPREARARGIEAELLVDWIKSSDLRQVSDPLGNQKLVTEKRLIYADASAGAYPGFMAYIEGFRERLASRREVKSGLLPYYQIQWGRERSLFESRRILFPYKAPASLFVNAANVFHSADVYSYVTDLDQQWLCQILNSPIYDRYIKTELKKLGGTLYEYYPHRLRRVLIPDPIRFPDAAAYLKLIEDQMGGTDHETNAAGL